MLLLATVHLFGLIAITISDTHWVISDHGTVQTKADSMFNMMQSHDLVQLLKQEDRVRKVTEAQKRLSNQKHLIDEHESHDDPKIEEKLMKNDADCLVAGKPLAQQDLFTSTHLAFVKIGEKISDHIGQVKSAPTRPTLPICAGNIELPYSFLAFEHLPSLQQHERVALSANPEISLLSDVYNEWQWQNTTDFGHAIAMALKKNRQSWQLYNLATLFWRASGNFPQAVECVRRALHFSPVYARSVAFLHLANILHQSGHSADAANVMETALAHNTSFVELFVTAGQIYAALLQYNRSIELFDHVLEVEPKLYKSIIILRAAVNCHRKLEQALENQHANLQKTLNELQSYHMRLKNLNKFQDDLTYHLIDSETREQMDFTYQHYTYGPLEGLHCDWTDDNGVKFLWCDAPQTAEDIHAYRENLDRRLIEARHKDDLPMNPVTGEILPMGAIVLEEYNQQPKKIRIKDEKTGRTQDIQLPTVDFDLEKRFLDALEPRRGHMSTLKPKREHKFAAGPVHSLTVDSDFPTAKQCAGVYLPRPDELESTFIPPDHKGFDTAELLNDFLLLNVTSQHPLPWYPPVCHVFDDSHAADSFTLPCCDHLLGVLKIKKRDRSKSQPEHDLKYQLLLLAKTSSDSEAEVGQRIHTLLKYNIGPKWFVMSLAAIYWRIVGSPSEALSCLRIALHQNETKYSDIPLLQLSQMTFKISDRVDDAIVMANQALEIDPNEPVTHFLLGFYHSIKENYTGAQHHVRESLALQQNFPRAFEFYTALTCRIKYPPPPSKKVTTTNECGVPRSGPVTENPKYFCVRENGEEHCYVEERFLPAEAKKAAQEMLSNLPSECVKAPPLENVITKKQNSQTKPPSTSSLNNVKRTTTLNVQDYEATVSSLTKAAHALTKNIQSIVGASTTFEEQIGSKTSGGHEVKFLRRYQSVIYGDPTVYTIVLSNPDNTNIEISKGIDGQLRKISVYADVAFRERTRKLSFTLRLAEENAKGPLKCTRELNLMDESYDPSPPISDELQDAFAQIQHAENELKRLQEQLARETAGLDALEAELEEFEEENADFLNQLENGEIDVTSSLSDADEQTQPEPPKKTVNANGLNDTELPEILPIPPSFMLTNAKGVVISLPSSSAECAYWKKRIKLNLPTSTWLSISAKGLDLKDYLDMSVNVKHLKLVQPVCPTESAGPVLSMEHLFGFTHRHKLTLYKPESGLQDAFRGLGNKKETVNQLATRLGLAIRNPTNELLKRVENRAHLAENSKYPWLFSTVAALYWRIQGNSSMAIDCLRHSLHFAPPNLRDLALVSLANVYHQAGMLNSALVVAGAALDVSPKYVVVHFTLANIYASMGDYFHATLFYTSTLSLQKNFEPAEERLKTVYCLNDRSMPTQPPSLTYV